MKRLRPVALLTLLILPSMLQGPTLRQDAALQSALVERAEAAQKILDHADQMTAAGRTAMPADSQVESETLWSLRAALALGEAGKLSMREALTQHLARVEKNCREAQLLYEAGRRTNVEVAILSYHLADAKVRLAALAR